MMLDAGKTPALVGIRLSRVPLFVEVPMRATHGCKGDL